MKQYVIIVFILACSACIVAPPESIIQTGIAQTQNSIILTDAANFTDTPQPSKTITPTRTPTYTLTPTFSLTNASTPIIQNTRTNDMTDYEIAMAGISTEIISWENASSHTGKSKIVCGPIVQIFEQKDDYNDEGGLLPGGIFISIGEVSPGPNRVLVTRWLDAIENDKICIRGLIKELTVGTEMYVVEYEVFP